MAAPKPLAGRQLRGMRARRNWHQRPCAVTGVELSMCARIQDRRGLYYLLKVPADGRCFFWVLLLNALDAQAKTEWRITERNYAGWAVCRDRQAEEETRPCFAHVRLTRSRWHSSMLRFVALRAGGNAATVCAWLSQHAGWRDRNVRKGQKPEWPGLHQQMALASTG